MTAFDKRATVLGAGGFIGSHLVRHLRALGYRVATPGRRDVDRLSAPLGHVFFAIGLTGNFREDPAATVEPHAALPGRLLARGGFDSFTYFSSTRIYAGACGADGTGEDAAVPVRPSADTSYDLSKMLGEALCLARDRSDVRVLRLANVYGDGQSRATFLGALLRDLAETGSATIREAPASSKDYVAVGDVVHLAEKIVRLGRRRVYNVASGTSVSHGEIAAALKAVGFSCAFAPGGALRAFPAIDTRRIVGEFGFTARSLLDDLPALLAQSGISPRTRSSTLG